MERLFRYERKTGMSSITTLVNPFFHPTFDLIGLNYSPVAHNTLHAFPEGWTAPLRLCRGIVLDCNGSIVAKPFEKFFNAGEHPETRTLPNEPFIGTKKHDGHLGIIFRYRDSLHLTTRGSFKSRTAVFGNAMLANIAARRNWNSGLPPECTLCAEIIHPQTHVFLHYGKQRRFMLLAAYDNKALREYAYDDVSLLARQLGIPVTERWQGTSLAELRVRMEDLSVQNEEGYVVRFENGLRVKFKFASYINKMVEAKLGYRYLMQRLIANNLDKMIKNLPEEVSGAAQNMVTKLRAAHDLPPEEQRPYLYALVPENEQTSYYKTVCRKFLLSR